MEFQYNFLRVKNKKTYFARVKVRKNVEKLGVRLCVEGSENGRKISEEWLKAAVAGAESALHCHVERGGKAVGLEITAVIGTDVDTTLDSIQTAAFLAAGKRWAAQNRI